MNTLHSQVLWRSKRKASKLSAALTLAFLLVAPFQTVFASCSAPTLSNGNLFTYGTITSKVDKPGGAFTQNMPLDIPPGRNGLQPSLSLQYSSQNLKDTINGYVCTY